MRAALPWRSGPLLLTPRPAPTVSPPPRRSGLDSFAAMQVVQVLKKIAQAGCAVLFTIHQPSSDVFNSFDRLLLLNRGRVLYQVSYIAAVQQVLRPLHKCSFFSVPLDPTLRLLQLNGLLQQYGWDL